jgi:hypothetical protein
MVVIGCLVPLQESQDAWAWRKWFQLISEAITVSEGRLSTERTQEILAL